MTTLHDGIIPIGKPCPWDKQCRYSQAGKCPRVDDQAFACDTARLFDAARMPTDEMWVIEGAEDG